MRNARGVTLIELAVVLGLLGLLAAVVAPTLGATLATLRTESTADVLYGALHLTRTRARATGVTHALVIERDGRAFRIVEDPRGRARTVYGPRTLVAGVLASGNTTIQFSPKGFAVPMGTITVRDGDEVRRVIVNIVGRVRVAEGPGGR